MQLRFAVLVLVLSIVPVILCGPAPPRRQREKQDFYELLGLKKSATEAQIKKAYRKAAREWHPDRNAHREKFATKRFREVAEAYEVLTDPKKREIYDQLGHAGLEQGPAADGNAGPGGPGAGGFPGGGMPGGFKFNFGGDGGGGGGGGGGGFFENLFSGFGGGGGGGPSGGPSGGPGGRRGGPHHHQPPPPPPSPPPRVDVEVGLEELLTGVTKDVLLPGGRRAQVTVPAGAATGSEITKDGAVFVVKDRPHSSFAREGHDLVHATNITLVQALSGSFTVPVPLLGSSRVIKFPVSKVVGPHTRMVLEDQGLPIPPKKGRAQSASSLPRGKLWITFSIAFPSKLTSEQFSKIKPVLEEAFQADKAKKEL